VTLSNNQCSMNAGTMSVTASGPNLLMSLPAMFTAAYTGAKSVYMYAAGSSGNSGWQQMGTWTVPASTPEPASVTPSSGSGLQQTFALQYSDPLGATDLVSAWVWFTSNFNTASAANSCLVYYGSGTNLLSLLNDAGTVWLSAPPGSAVTLSNSACSINVAGATVTLSGTNSIVSLPVTFTPGYAGAKSIYMYAAGSSANSGWQALGSWTVPAVSTPEPASVTPSSGSGLQQTFALQYSDPLGTSDVTSAWVWFTSNFNLTSAANACLVYYARATNLLFLLNDAGTVWSSATLGAAVTLSNSQCSVNVAAATAAQQGTLLTVNAPVTFTAGYAGLKGVYMYVAGSSGNSGWQAMGSWTVP
jgi:hypothetical protein